MKLNFTHQQLATIFNTPIILGEEKRSINSVSTDTRTLIDGSTVLFFAFNGKRKGVSFVQQAYDLGCRNFVIPTGEKVKLPKDALVYEVKDVLFSLQELAKTHRNLWKGKIIAIAGGVGKTTVKEWLYHVLQDSFNIVRSPKSYNSQLGVALSLLELGEKNNLAIIEAGISKEGEMARLEEIIRPDYGILTNMSERSRGMLTKEIQWKEKTSLFKNSEWVIGRKVDVENLKNGIGWEEGKDISYQLIDNHAI
ncbi:MAG: Mur ligase family protein, partial [Crocinitomicaceae bacterium]